MTLEAFITLVILGAVVSRLWVWARAGRVSPDPWGPEVDAALQSAEATPICPHCQTPQDHIGWFCPGCGATVGQFGNFLPSVWIYSVSDGGRRLYWERVRSRRLLWFGYCLALMGFAPMLLPVAFFYLLKTIQSAAENPNPAQP